MIYRNFLTSLLLLFCLLGNATGWPKKKGAGYFKLGYSVINGRNFFDEKGDNIKLVQPLQFNTASFYGEYGLTNRITASSYIPFATTARLAASSTDPGGSITSFGDINFGILYGIITDKKHVLSASITLGIPTGKFSTDQTEGVGSLQTGDGEFNQMLRLESGHSFSNGFYATSYAGINIRSRGFSEELRLGGEFGHVSTKWIIILKFESIQSFNNGSFDSDMQTGFFNNNMEVTSISPEIAFRFNKSTGISLNHSVYLAGKKTFASPNTTIGFYIEI